MIYIRQNYNLLFIIILTAFVFSIELGIESFEKQKDGTYLADIYMLNEQPLAGFQLDLLPLGLFEIQTISGGRGESAGFTMSAGKKGTMLGFSFSGATIEPSKSTYPEENIIFTLSLKVIGKIDEKTEITFTTIMAGRGGEQLITTVQPFKPVSKKSKKIVKKTK